MKLYHWKPAPNPRRVLIFLAEKGISVPMEDVGQGFVLRPDYVQRYAPADTARPAEQNRRMMTTMATLPS
jgi:glutathione S-transferase